MRVDRRAVLIASLAGVASQARGQTPPPSTPASMHLADPDPTETVDLWPGSPPAMAADPPAEHVHERSNDRAYNDRIVLGISRPRMAVFRPARPNGAAVLIAPGGGYSWVVVDKEGYEMARLLAARGVTAFVLFYRLPHEGWASGPDTPLADAQRAMRLVRHRAADYEVDPARICFMGFSAGGHVCADLIARFTASVYAPIDVADGLSARPDAAAPIYPVVAMSGPFAHAGSRTNLLGAETTPDLERAHDPSLNLTAQAPPCFLLHAEDDVSVPVQNTLMLRDALRARGIPAETHLFPDGGHGFGLRLTQGKSVEHWPDLFINWARHQGLWL
jgi:acetyl esterase/lipase